MVSNLQKLVMVVALGLASTQIQAGEWRKASDWQGMLVVTNKGENVGQVEDFALDLDTGEVNYVVVSVGSFLIKDALIAVAPKALSEDAGRLVIAADSVAGAARFGNDNWPALPGVLAGSGTDTSASGSSAAVAAGDGAQGAQAGTNLPSSGVATISSSRRTATLSAQERRIDDVAPSAVQKSNASTPAITRVPNGPLPSFGALDRNRNGVLDRREIGSWLNQNDSYDEVDLDSSGTVDRFEFDIFSAERK